MIFIMFKLKELGADGRTLDLVPQHAEVVRQNGQERAMMELTVPERISTGETAKRRIVQVLY